MVDSRKVLEERAGAAVTLAKSLGADEAWASASSTRSTSCEVRNGKVEKMQESNSRRLGLELYVQGRYFQHRTSDLRDVAEHRPHGSLHLIELLLWQSTLLVELGFPEAGRSRQPLDHLRIRVFEGLRTGSDDAP